MSYFVRGGLQENQININSFDALKTRLDYNTKSTEDLLLQYFSDLADDMVRLYRIDIHQNLEKKT